MFEEGSKTMLLLTLLYQCCQVAQGYRISILLEYQAMSSSTTSASNNEMNILQVLFLIFSNSNPKIPN